MKRQTKKSVKSKLCMALLLAVGAISVTTLQAKAETVTLEKDGRTVNMVLNPEVDVRQLEGLNIRTYESANEEMLTTSGVSEMDLSQLGASTTSLDWKKDSGYYNYAYGIMKDEAGTLYALRPNSNFTKLYLYKGSDINNMKKVEDITALIQKKWSAAKNLVLSGCGYSISSSSFRFSVWVKDSKKKVSRWYDIKIENGKCVIEESYSFETNYKDNTKFKNRYYMGSIGKAKKGSKIKLQYTKNGKKYTTVTTNVKYTSSAEWVDLRRWKNKKGKEVLLLFVKDSKNPEKRRAYYSTDGKKFKKTFKGATDWSSYGGNAGEIDECSYYTYGIFGKKVGVYQYTKLDKVYNSKTFKVANKKKAGVCSVPGGYVISTGKKNYYVSATGYKGKFGKVKSVPFSAKDVTNYRSIGDDTLIFLKNGKMVVCRNNYTKFAQFKIPKGDINTWEASIYSRDGEEIEKYFTIKVTNKKTKHYYVNYSTLEKAIEKAFQ